MPITITFYMTVCVCGVCTFVCSEDDVVQDFLWVDSCAKVADKVSVCMYYTMSCNYIQ